MNLCTFIRKLWVSVLRQRIDEEKELIPLRLAFIRAAQSIPNSRRHQIRNRISEKCFLRQPYVLSQCICIQWHNGSRNKKAPLTKLQLCISVGVQWDGGKRAGNGVNHTQAKEDSVRLYFFCVCIDRWNKSYGTIEKKRPWTPMALSLGWIG